MEVGKISGAGGGSRLWVFIGARRTGNFGGGWNMACGVTSALNELYCITNSSFKKFL